MAEALIGGAVLGAVVGEMLKAVLDAKQKASAFRPSLTRLETTLKAIIPRLEQLNTLNYKLNPQQEEGMEELVTLIINGKELVRKCSKISAINFVRKVQYSKELLDLDNSLLRYFVTVLPLDQFKDTKEILVTVKELHKLAGNTAPPATSLSDSSNEERVQNGDQEEQTQLVSEGVKSSNSCKMELHMTITDDKDGEIASQSEAAGNMELQMPLADDKDKDITSQNEPASKSQEKAGNLFFFENQHCNLDPEDIDFENEALFNETYGSSYRYDKDVFNQLRIKRLKKVKVGGKEFRQQIEFIRTIGQHPNIEFPMGYYFSAEEKLLLYALAVEKNLFQRLHENSLEKIPFSYTKYYRLQTDHDLQRIPLHWKARVKIALRTARGISHLHSVKLIHGNIASSNVLLKWDLDVIISDYGFAPIMNLSATTSQNSGYHAPEFIESGEATQKSDAYSFGIMLLELLSGRRPDEYDIVGRAYLYMVDRKHWTFDSELQYDKYKEEIEAMRVLAMQCVDKAPNRRPEMDDIVSMIENIQAMSPEPSEYYSVY